MDAFQLHTDSWRELLRSDMGREWMFPVLAHLVDEDGQSLVEASEEQMDALLDTAASVPADVMADCSIPAMISGTWRRSR